MMTSYRNILGLIVMGFGLTSVVNHQADQWRSAEANTPAVFALTIRGVSDESPIVEEITDQETVVTANQGGALRIDADQVPLKTIATANHGGNLDSVEEGTEIRTISSPNLPMTLVMSTPDTVRGVDDEIDGDIGDEFEDDGETEPEDELEEEDRSEEHDSDDFRDFDFGDSLHEDVATEVEPEQVEPPTTVVPNRPVTADTDEEEVEEVEPSSDPIMETTPTTPTTPTAPRPTIETNEAETAKLIRVSVNSSVTVDLKTKIDRIELADPTVAEVLVPAPGKVIVVGKSAGATQLLLQIGSEYHVFHVAVQPNFTVLKELIDALSPSSRVYVDTLNGQIVLRGHVPDGETALRIEQLATVHQGGEVVNHLTVAGVQQTLVRVVVAEVNKESLRALGVNWAVGASQLSRDFFLANNLGQLNPTNFSSNGLADVTTGQLTYSVAPTGLGPNTNITFGFPRAELQFFFNALRENGLARTLAEPNLVAISGQTASFLAGGEVPIPISQGGAVAGAITIEYKEFGVRLAFTPTVVGGQVIRLHVMTEVSEAIPTTGPGAGGLPLFAFNTRRVESTIECGNDQTFAIAGLLDSKINAVASKIPGLGDLPILGTLFSSVSYQKEETELIVLVTPQLVEPLDLDQVGPPPGTLMKDPSDFELFALQQLEGGLQEELEEAMESSEESDEDINYSASDSAPAPSLQGPWGVEDSDMVSVAK